MKFRQHSSVIKSLSTGCRVLAGVFLCFRIYIWDGQRFIQIVPGLNLPEREAD